MIYHAWHRFELNDRLLRQRRFWVKGRYYFGQDLPGSESITRPSTKQSPNPELLKLGHRLLLPGAEEILTVFRGSAAPLLAKFQRHTVQWDNVPVKDTPEHAAWMERWQQQSSDTKSHTFLQCPPQSFVDQDSEACINVMGRNKTGSTKSSLPRVRVAPFQLQATPVTRAQYAVFDRAFATSEFKVRSGRPLREVIEQFAAPRSTRSANVEEAADYPLIMTSWHDAWVCSKWLGPEYGLPTECRHEFGIRGGNPEDYCFGNDDAQHSQLKKYAWFDDNSNSQSHAVGKKRANAYGLLDVHGNVWEWSHDWHQNRASWAAVNTVIEEHLGPVSGSSRVLRGGSYRDIAARCRSGRRDYDPPDYRSYYVGFRLCVE